MAARTVGGTKSGIRRAGVVPDDGILVLLEQLAPTERAVFLLREVFELDLDEIARTVGKSEANTRQILTRARCRLHDARPRFTVSRRESEEVVRRFRHGSRAGDDGICLYRA